LRDLHVPAAGRATIQIIALFEFRLGPQVLLGEHLGVGFTMLIRMRRRSSTN
jgi:hypothetical protein